MNLTPFSFYAFNAVIQNIDIDTKIKHIKKTMKFVAMMKSLEMLEYIWDV